jgi:hypothetical protein
VAVRSVDASDGARAPGLRGRPPSSPPEDPYQQLLSRTRDLRIEQRQARDAWFQQLELEGKDEVLFELEVLLKAAACFANPRNHPGPHRRGPVVAQDFRQPLAVARDGMAHAVALSRSLLGHGDRAFLFHRYLETVLPQDDARTRLSSVTLEQTTPEQSLLGLRQGLSGAIEVLDGLGRAPRIPYRTFYAALGVVQREVERNTFFNPLNALEFRPEFDRIRSPQVLDLIRGVSAREAHRLVSLTFLSLFRMLRYLRLLERISVESGRRRRLIGRAHLTASVLRSDGRALSGYLRQNAGRLLADAYHHELAATRVDSIRLRSAELRSLADHYLRIRDALEGVAASLQLEMRRAFQHDLGAPDMSLGEAELRAGVRALIHNLRPTLRAAVSFFGRVLGVPLVGASVFEDPAATADVAERLRRDVWMFAQILRAFALKAQAPTPEPRWLGGEQPQFVREFLRYFTAMGYPVLQQTGYSGAAEFVSAMRRIDASSDGDRAHLERAVRECQAFHRHLEATFEALESDPALADVPFDRRAAARALKRYVAA